MLAFTDQPEGNKVDTLTIVSVIAAIVVFALIVMLIGIALFHRYGQR